MQDNRSDGWVDLTPAAPRRAREGQSIRHVQADLRDRLAATADRVAATFEISAKARERMAARSSGDGDAEYHRLRGERHRAIAEFERKQAHALRQGYLLATTPPGADEPHQGQ